MDERFELLRIAFPQFAGDYAPPWGLPTIADFAYLEERYGCQYPPSFVLYQTHYAAVLPSPDHCFRWANRGLDRYLSIEDAILGARQMGVAGRLVPFCDDEGNFTCFDTIARKPDNEWPVVFWEHDARSATRTAPDFITWLEAMYRSFQGR